MALGISAWLTAREQDRLRDARAHLQEMHEFHRIHLVVVRRLVTWVGSSDERAVSSEEVSHHIDDLISLSLNPETPEKLEALRLRLRQATTAEGGQLSELLIMFQEVGLTERASEAQLLASLEEQTGTQLHYELAAPIAILAVGVLLVPMMRRRIIKPLAGFGRQLSHLAAGEFTPTPLDDADPVLLPLHRKFNDLVRRLQELEAEHQARAESLQEEVRAATRALLEQQRSLARAERLAATGEFAASVAHELRNPLAGIQMTLSNLRADIQDPELIERVELVANEVTRLTRLLNEVLDASRHAPEPPRPVHLATLVDDMVTLTRCQLAPEIRLESAIDADLICRLPQDRLRQALLNVILNAATALGDNGGTVRISAAQQDDRVRISVVDDGPGFPPELLDSGILPFFSTRERGTGFGLAMVRRFARDLGGDIELANCRPHGASVTLVLPSVADHG